ncbi:MAG: aldo/keto reductase [Acidobacteria bacterium]|nr:aldo/keto reductase [Acidobacteriota bacterium]
MKYRKLGRTGFLVSEVGFGGWGIGGALWKGGQDAESIAAVRRAIELGINFIDTALVYGDGHGERQVAEALRDAGQKIYVATKVPPKNLEWPARPGTRIEEVFPYDHIVSSTEQSLRNLRVDGLDLQQLHVWNPEWAGSAEWRRAFEDLKRSGKVRAAGVSVNDHQPDSAIEVLRSGLIDTVQVIYNIFDQSAERGLFRVAQEHNIGVIARSPLDEGGLTARITPDTEFYAGDFRGRYFAGERKRQVAGRVAALRRDLGISEDALPEAALRFCLSHPAVSTVIPGMRSRRNAEANAAVPELGPLPEAMLEVVKHHAWERNFYA